MNLREHLKEILPAILPKSAAESIKGTQLIKMVKMRLGHPYSDATLRYHFSVMSCDPSSPIAKVDQGQGYYLRSVDVMTSREYQPRFDQRLVGFEPGMEGLAHDQLWRKFQAFYERYANVGASVVFPVRHGDFKETPNDLFWTVPDTVVVHWKNADDLDGKVRLRPELLCAEPTPFAVTSVKLVLGIHVENYRRVFFQCLSNSSWAHVRELVIATKVLDESLAEDLRRLGKRHGIGVSAFNFTEERLHEWADPEEIESMPADEFDRLREMVDCRRIVAPEASGALDWEHFNQLSGLQPEFENLFRWIHQSLRQKQVSSYAEFERAARLPVVTPS